MARAVSLRPRRPRTPGLAICRPLTAVLAATLRDAYGACGRSPSIRIPWTRAAVRVFRAYLAANRGAIDECHAEAAEAYAGFRELGDRWGMGSGLSILAEVALAEAGPRRRYPSCGRPTDTPPRGSARPGGHAAAPARQGVRPGGGRRAGTGRTAPGAALAVSGSASTAWSPTARSG